MTPIKHGVDMIAVEWLDSTYCDMTHYVNTEKPFIDKLALMYTVGFLVYEDEEKVALSVEWIAEDKQFRSSALIPKVNIIRQHRWKLRWPISSTSPKP